jgi:hypothetical protein
LEDGAKRERKGVGALADDTLRGEEQGQRESSAMAKKMEKGAFL